MSRSTDKTPTDPPAVLEQTAAATDTATDVERAAEKRRQAANPVVGSPEWQRQGMVDGLLAERRGFVNRGDDKSVALVDEQLAHYGHTGGGE